MTRLVRKSWKLYSRLVPSYRVRMAVCKIGAEFDQHTAIDDCSRYW